jgi:hypothetical protein
MDLHDLATLGALYRRTKAPTPPFWLQNFPNQINFDTPQIYFEKVFGDDRHLAPFVIPTMPGRPQKLDGYAAESFAPAYIKILDPVDPSMFIKRQAGEAFITGSMTLDQRRNAVVVELLRKGRQKIQNRNEWLAARAIIDGKVTIEGEDYPSTLVDFRRDAGLTVTLAGTAKWDQSGTADPLANLKDARQAANELSGARIRNHVFGANAWDLFNQRVDLKELMNKNFGGLNVNVTRMSDGWSDQGQEFMGTIQGLNGAGAINAWVDTSKYIDPEDGTEKFFLDQDTVVGVSDMVSGTRCFGAIMDKRAGYRPLDVFFKNYEQENPSVEYLLLQSAPLMVPREPNATFSIKVV